MDSEELDKSEVTEINYIEEYFNLGYELLIGLIKDHD